MIKCLEVVYSILENRFHIFQSLGVKITLQQIENYQQVRI